MWMISWIMSYYGIYMTLCMVTPIVCVSLYDYDQLYKDLMKDYNKLLRPVSIETERVNVTVELELISIVEVNEIEQSIAINGLFTFKWKDISLQWDPALYNGANQLYVEQKELWRPDIFLTNTLDTRKNLGFSDMKVIIVSSGEVAWFPGDIYKLSCTIDVTLFPYDQQECQIEVSTWISSSLEITLQMDTEGVVSQNVKNELWNLKNTKHDVDETYGLTLPSARIKLFLERRSGYYVVNIIIPVVLLSAVNVLVFLLPADSGEKIGLSITVLLAFVVFLTVLGAQLPISSLHTSYLTIYISTLIVISCLSLLATVVVLIVHHKSPGSPLPTFLKQLIRCTRCVICRKSTRRVSASTSHVDSVNVSKSFDRCARSSGRQEENSDSGTNIVAGSPNEGSPADLDNTMNWQDGARSLDMIFFVFFTSAAAVSTLVFMLLMT